MPITPGALSDFVEQQIAAWLFQNTTPTPPATLYLAAYTVAPTDAGGGVEVAGGGYARVAMSTGAAGTGAGGDFAVAVVGGVTQVTNANDELFPEATIDWGTIVAFGLFDDPAAGNLRTRFLTDSAGNPISQVILNGDQLRCKAGKLLVVLD